jgi:hypothetical protein
VTVDDSQIVKALTQYAQQHPYEATALIAPYAATRDHVTRATCTHDNRCPIVRAGALLVDERERVLVLRAGNRWEFTGVHNPWTVPGAEDPLVIDVTQAAPEDGPRLRVGFRYLFRAHSDAVCPALIKRGQARWVPLSAIETPLLLQRLQSELAVLL